MTFVEYLGLLGAFALFFLAPGFACSLLLLPRWAFVFHISISPALSLALVAVFRILTAPLGISFSIASYLPFLIIFVATSLWARKRVSIVEATIPIREFLLVAAASLLVYAQCKIGLWGYLLPPHNHDASHHAHMIAAIYQNHAFSLSSYPQTMHANMALMVPLLSIPIPSIALETVILITSLLPVSVYVFLFFAFGDRRVAAIAALLSITFGYMPYTVFGWGGWAMLISFQMMMALAGVAWAMLARRGWRSYAFLALSITALFFTHMTEVLSFGLLLGLLILYNSRLILRNKATVLLRIIMMSALLGVFMIPYLNKDIVKPSDANIQYFTPSAERVLDRITKENIAIFQGKFNTLMFKGRGRLFLWALATIGVISAALRHRAWLLLVLLHLATVVWGFDYYVTKIMMPVARPLFTWSDPVRMSYLWSLTLSGLAGLGTYWLFVGSQRFLYSKLQTQSTYATHLLLILAMATIIIPCYSNYELLRSYLRVSIAVSENDMKCIEWLGKNTPLDSMILTDRSEGPGKWIPSLIFRKIMFPYHVFPNAIERDRDGSYLRDNINELAFSPEMRRLMEKHNIRYIFASESKLNDREARLYKECLLTNPALSLLYEQGNAAVFSYRLEALTQTLVRTFDIGTLCDDRWLREGFHAREKSNEGVTFRWLKKRAAIEIPGNSKEYKYLDVNLSKRLPFKVVINGVTAYRSDAINPAWQTVTIALPQPGIEKHRIEIYTPGAAPLPTDERELGIAINWIKLMPGTSAGNQ